MVDPSQLIPNPKNPRLHSKKQLSILKAAVRLVGIRSPLLFDENHVLIAGHARQVVALDLGLELAPVIKYSDLSEAEKRALILADNRVAELADWDMDLVREDCDYLIENNIDFGITGFELGDLKFGTAPTGLPETEPKVTLPSTNAVAICQLGDAWTFGPPDHCSRFIIGDREKRPQRQAPMLRFLIGSFAVSVIRTQIRSPTRPQKIGLLATVLWGLENHSISRECVVTVAVLTEPVSAAKFPVPREFAGKHWESRLYLGSLVGNSRSFIVVSATKSLDTRTANNFGGTGKK